jgi:dTDP-4-dehydrorhamnose reductase
MKVLLTGSNGQLGKSIIKLKPIGVDIIETRKKDLNLSDEKDCRSAIIDIKPDWVINCGAYTNVEKAESEKEIAFYTNGYALKFFSEELLKTGGKILQISTDYVFNGEQEFPYKPNQKTSPLNIYGESKVLGEKYVKDILGIINRGFVIRTSWLISPYSNSFVSKILKLLNEKDELNIINDQFSCPTCSEALAKLCWKFVFFNQENSKFNFDNQLIYHFCDSGITNWYELSLAIREYGKEYSLLKDPAIIKPISSCEYNAIAKRPKFSLLDNRDTIEKLEIKTNHWRENLRNIIESITLLK